MRAGLIEHDVVECVLGLGPNLFYNSPMEACVVICRTDKPEARKNKILFINAVNEVSRERAQSFLTDAHIQRIVAAYRAFADEEGFARLVSVDEIRNNGNNLSIPLYIRGSQDATRPEWEAVSLQQAIADWQQSSLALRDSMNELLGMLEKTPISTE